MVQKMLSAGSFVYALHQYNDNSIIILTGRTKGDGRQDYKNFSDAMQHLNRSGEKNLYCQLYQTLLELATEVGNISAIVS